MVDRIWVDGVIRDMTAEEQAEADKVKAEWNNSSEKLKRIKRLRLEKLVETDWWVLRGNMSEAQTTYRQSMRDIPQDYSEADYDDLLARDEQGNLTHTVWSKP
jgi:hypothetical protein